MLEKSQWKPHYTIQPQASLIRSPRYSGLRSAFRCKGPNITSLLRSLRPLISLIAVVSRYLTCLKVWKDWRTMVLKPIQCTVIVSSWNRNSSVVRRFVRGAVKPCARAAKRFEVYCDNRFEYETKTGSHISIMLPIELCFFSQKPLHRIRVHIGKRILDNSVWRSMFD